MERFFDEAELEVMKAMELLEQEALEADRKQFELVEKEVEDFERTQFELAEKEAEALYFMGVQ